MKLIRGHLNYSIPWTLPNVYLFTGNSTIKNNGAIVMGRGAAKQVRDTWPGVDRLFGAEVRAEPEFNVIILGNRHDQYLGWFKVKENWWEEASIDLIRESTIKLADLAIKQSDFIFHMNFPGVGNGRLDIQQVRPVIKVLPNNVLIYQ